MDLIRHFGPKVSICGYVFQCVFIFQSNCTVFYLCILGTEGAVFGHSVETPHIRAEPSQDLK